MSLFRRKLCNMKMHNLELWSQPRPAISLGCHKPQRLMLGWEMLPPRTDSNQENKRAAFVSSVKPESLWAGVIQWQSVCSRACEANNFWALFLHLYCIPFYGHVTLFSVNNYTNTFISLFPVQSHQNHLVKAHFYLDQRAGCHWCSLSHSTRSVTKFHRQFFHLKITHSLFLCTGQDTNSQLNEWVNSVFYCRSDFPLTRADAGPCSNQWVSRLRKTTGHHSLTVRQKSANAPLWCEPTAHGNS